MVWAILTCFALAPPGQNAFPVEALLRPEHAYGGYMGEQLHGLLQYQQADVVLKVLLLEVWVCDDRGNVSLLVSQELIRVAVRVVVTQPDLEVGRRIAARARRPK